MGVNAIARAHIGYVHLSDPAQGDDKAPAHAQNASAMSETIQREPLRDAARSRLDRLEGFLAADPRNASLRADVFQAALQCGEWERARAQLHTARAAQPDDPAWALREADWWLAQRHYPQAREALEALALRSGSHPGLGDVVTYNLAYIEFAEGRWDACVELLRPQMEPPRAGSALAQMLWLRALHRADRSDAAREWAAQAEQAGVLAPAAAGVAALAAIDEDDMPAAMRWAGLASQADAAPTMELLVARSTLTLAARQPQAARQFAAQALALNAQDGRAWSAGAFAAMLTGDLETAQAEFERSLSFMPGHIGTWHGLGWCGVLRGDLARARSAFESALELDRNFGESHGGLAVVLALQKQELPAREHIELARRLDRANLSSRYAEALLAGEAQDVDGVRRLAERLLGGRAGPLGGTMADWLPPRDKQH